MSARRTPQRVSTAIRFESDIADELRLLAAEHGLSINWLVNRCLRAGLASFSQQLGSILGAPTNEDP